MKKKIVVLTGNPRKNGNSFLMADSFISAAEKEGHTVTRFDTAFLDVKPCRACGRPGKEAVNGAYADASLKTHITYKSGRRG